MITSNNALIDSIMELSRAPAIDKPTVERVLGCALIVEPERSTDFFVFYSANFSTEKSLVQSVDFRQSRSTEKRKSGFLALSLGQTCTLAASEIRGRFGEPDALVVPTPGASRRYSVEYVYGKLGGKIRFAIGPEPAGKVVSITIDRTESD